jgi:hypothetical protein
LKNPFFDPFFSGVVRDSTRSGIDGNRRRAHAGADSRTRIAMVTSAVIVTLLTIVASLASWLFSQWLARRARVSGLALAVGGVGTVLLIGAVALVMVTASTSWQQLIPVQDFSPMIAPAPVTPRSAQPPVEQYAERVEVDDAVSLTQVGPPPEFESIEEPEVITPRYRFGQPKDGMLDAAEGHLEASEYASAIDVARRYLAEHPRDAEMSSLLARSLFAAQYPGTAETIPAVVVAEWPATDCVQSTRADGSAHWILDNGCGRVVAVLFASCQLSETACFTNALVSQGWQYEATGILMTAETDKPLPLRLGEDGPLVAPIFTIRDAAGARRQIRYLACEVTAPGVLRLLRGLSDQLTSQRLTAELRADACYSQVLDWSRSGHRLGASPDALLLRRIN